LSVIRAKSGTASYREEDGYVVLALRDVSVETRDRKEPENFSKPPLIATFESTSLELPPETVGGGATQGEKKKKSKWMTYHELSSRRAELAAKGASSTKEERAELTNLTVTLHTKAAASFAVLAFALVAVPLGIKVSRKETSANLGIAVALVLGYYFLAALAGTLERSPALRPELWVWAPPLIYTAVGVWLFRRVDRA
jgi:lipopolysaccharide export system permease protein